MQWMESSIPILHTSHPSTGKCSGSKKNWHQTSNHPFTFTSFTWILECWSWKGVECRLSSAESARHRFPPQLLHIFGYSCFRFLATAAAAADFWPCCKNVKVAKVHFLDHQQGNFPIWGEKNSSPDVISSEGPDEVWFILTGHRDGKA